MLNENPRQLHLLMGKGAVAAFMHVNLGPFKKKYVGDHVALVRPEDVATVEAMGLFKEVHSLNMSYVQRSSFSPLLGDEAAFHAFYAALAPLARQKWTRLFNLKGSAIDNAVSELFTAQTVIGACARNNERRCQEPPLKMVVLLDQWKMNHLELQQWLFAKGLGQLDWAAVEVCLQKVIEAKAVKSTNPLKNLLLGVRMSELQAHETELELLQKLFTVVDLEKEDPTMAFFVDLCVGAKPNAFVTALPVEKIHPDSLVELLPEALATSLTKWSSLSTAFDYLGNARAALASEKIIARYDRDALQQFLFAQVMALKAFARVLLDVVRRPVQDARGPLESFWASTPGVITFNSAIELSLQPGVSPLLRTEQDLLAVKRRMRSLNQFFERLHRATAIEIPKTDLELTL